MSSSPPNSAEGSRLLDNDHMRNHSYSGDARHSSIREQFRTSNHRRSQASQRLSAEFHTKLGEEPLAKKALSGIFVVSASGVGVAVYLLVGVAMYATVAGMGVLDALYFCIVTLTTVGYGDLSAHKPVTKLFACFYILIGVAMVGALLATLVEMLLDRQEKLLLTMMRKVTQPEAGGENDPEETGKLAPQEQGKTSNSAKDTTAKRLKVKVWGGILWFFVLMGAGTLLFVFVEKLSVVDALYLTVVSASTVGYGDYYPTTPATKIFAVFFLPITTLLLAKIVSDYTSMQVELNTEARQHRILYQAISAHDFNEMDVDGDGQIDPMEFMCRTLIAQEKLQQEDIDDVIARFNQLDQNNDGHIEKAEIHLAQGHYGDAENPGGRGSIQ